MRTRLSMRAGILVVVIASLLVGTSVLAQGPFAPSGTPFDAVLAKLDQIIEMLAPGTPAAGPVTLSTGLVIKAPPDTATCDLTNISTAPILGVRFMLIGHFGQTIVEETHDVGPGRTIRISHQDLTSGSSGRCVFSFVGSADNTRAHLVIYDAVFEPLVVLDAR
jgi:hypothetical protein